MGGTHAVLVDHLGLEDEGYDARPLRGIDDELNPLQPGSRMCFLLKYFLSARSGFDRDDIQGYLDLFSVAMNAPADKLEKAALVFWIGQCIARIRCASATSTM